MQINHLAMLYMFFIKVQSKMFETSAFYFFYSLGYIFLYLVIYSMQSETVARQTYTQQFQILLKNQQQQMLLEICENSK